MAPDGPVDGPPTGNPGYGTMNAEWFAALFERDDPGGPMWALNLMKYRERAVYADGRETELSGIEADDAYAPLAEIAAVGGRMAFVAPVVHQLRGDATVWDRIGIVQYPTRIAIVEMNNRDDFQRQHEHKEAGMESTIVVASFPADGGPTPDPTLTAAGDHRMLLQVVGDPSFPDAAADIDSTPVGRFSIETVMIGDGRTFAEARYDRISIETAEALAATDPVTDDDENYVMVIDPMIDALAETLSDPTRVLV